MLEIKVKIPEREKQELWDESKQEFVYVPASSGKEEILRLEHSLVSLSKWESKWCKSFFGKEDKTQDEVLDYIKCMALNKDVKQEIFYYLSEENVKEINDYISAPMTATTFSNRNSGSSRETITSEIIYYWMISFKIPFECQKWHLNRLLTLIRVCEVKNQPPKKLSKGELMRRNAALNAARKKELNTTG